jgi:threonine/homoserine/homoserine lactone efflux protein
VERLIPGLATILLFCGVSFVMVATPGPGVLYVVGRSIDQGRRAGVASMIGIESAEVVHVVAVALGLSALLAASAHALDVLRYAGAAYLIVLGMRRWRGSAREVEGHAEAATPRRITAQGFVVQLFNPKVAIFFLAYFPQFLDRDAPILPQTLLLGALYVTIAACSDLAYVLLSSLIADRLKRSALARRRVARASALTYIGLGVTAALSGERAAATTR